MAVAGMITLPSSGILRIFLVILVEFLIHSSVVEVGDEVAVPHNQGDLIFDRILIFLLKMLFLERKFRSAIIDKLSVYPVVDQVLKPVVAKRCALPVEGVARLGEVQDFSRLLLHVQHVMETVM